MNLFTNRSRVTDIKNEVLVAKGENAGRDMSGVWAETHTLLYIRQKTYGDLLYSTGNPTQYSVITCMGKESKKE